jgi:hypothetical protein
MKTTSLETMHGYKFMVSLIIDFDKVPKHFMQLFPPLPYTTFCLLRVNAWYNGSKIVENILPIGPYKIFLNDSNGHSCYFKKY